MTLVVAAGFGLVVAVIGAFWQSAQVSVGSVLVPTGLLGALLITWAGARVVSSLTPGRSAAVAVALGWTAGAVALSWARGAGDVVVPGTWYGYLYLGGGLAIVSTVAILAAPLLPVASERSTVGR